MDFYQINPIHNLWNAQLLALPGTDAALRELDALAVSAPAAPPRHLLPARRAPEPPPPGPLPSSPAGFRRAASSFSAPPPAAAAAGFIGRTLSSEPGVAVGMSFRRTASTFSALSLSLGGVFSSWPDGGAGVAPVTGLDQLYAQAG